MLHVNILIASDRNFAKIVTLLVRGSISQYLFSFYFMFIS